MKAGNNFALAGAGSLSASAQTACRTGTETPISLNQPKLHLMLQIMGVLVLTKHVPGGDRRLDKFPENGKRSNRHEQNAIDA